jgi:hypothetical protein
MAIIKVVNVVSDYRLIVQRARLFHLFWYNGRRLALVPSLDDQRIWAECGIPRGTSGRVFVLRHCRSLVDGLPKGFVLGTGMFGQLEMALLRQQPCAEGATCGAPFGQMFRWRGEDGV